MTGRLLSIILLLASACMASAQTGGIAPDGAQEEIPEVITPEIQEISDRMDSYFMEMSEIMATIAYVNSTALKGLERKLQALNLQWNTYTEIQQIIIAGSPLLMEDMSRYNILYMSAVDSIGSQKVRLEAVSSFAEAEKRMKSEFLPKYEDLLKESQKLSMIQQTASQLERLKASEQITLASVQETYEKAKQSAGLNPALEERMKGLEEDYITIQNCSEKIQAAEFKPLITRIKDYVLTFAGVAVLIMFISMVQSKIAAAKAARETARKYKEMAGRNDEYPTI